MSSTNKYVCIHGHFYQPPRENAWLGVIERQDSAAPFHNWNERINFECYAPNTAARILDEGKRIQQIINNYARISFNFGPTLLSWLELADPEAYQSILRADRLSLERFNGHGSAIAQVHSHLILPLANQRDKETQVIWGIRDFESRFQRVPEGMWLAETAVNTETLEVLADNGIQYTILAPRQAKAVRPLNGNDQWRGVHAESIDSRQPYLVQLPSGKTIAVFFYHGALSQAVAFDGLLNNGRHFAERLTSAFGSHSEPQLVHIATDGESYGHHHRYGEMALAACLHHIETHQTAQLINYGAFLEKFPPTMEAQIHENSSWSCAHGVERWRSNCGCNSGGNPGWTQEWRAPLRNTLNWLRDELAPVFEQEGGKLLIDVWAARNDYIDIILDRNATTERLFFEKHAKHPLNPDEKTQAIRLLEMQHHALLMFTSCGWFFDEISGIETLQILQYANRAIYYADQVSGKDYHPSFLNYLAKAPSNVYANGAVSYKKFVEPDRVDLERVGMHYAASSMFAESPHQLEFFNYRAESEVYERLVAGTQRLAVGRTIIHSKITHSRKHFSFLVLYMGQQTIFGNISINMDRETFDVMHQRVFESFRSSHIAEVIGLMQEYFGPRKYSIWHLFKDEKRKILQQVGQESMNRAENYYREIYNESYQLMIGFKLADIPIPKAYLNAVQFIVNKDLRRYFERNGATRVKELMRLREELEKWEVELSDAPTLKLAASERIYGQLLQLKESKLSLEAFQDLVKSMEVMYEMGLRPDVWKSQNLYFSIVKAYKNGDWVFANKEWEAAFLRMAELLSVGI